MSKSRRKPRPSSVWAVQCHGEGLTIYDEAAHTVMTRHGRVCSPGLWSVGVCGAQAWAVVEFFSSPRGWPTPVASAVMDDFGNLVRVP